MHNDPDTLDAGRALRLIARRAPLVLLCGLVVAAAAYGFSKRQVKKYQATASLVFSVNPLSQQIAGLPPSSTGNLLAQQASNVELVKLGDMAAKTAAAVGGGLTAQSVTGALAVRGQGESSVVDVTATATSPTLAARIANIYTARFVAEQQSTNHAYFKSALGLVNKQLAQLPAKQRYGPGAVALQNRAQTLRLLDTLRYGNVQVAQQALPPLYASSPKTSKNTLVGAVLGLLIGLGLVFALERVARERRIRDPEELPGVYGLPLLGAVPHSRALSPRGTREHLPLSAADREAFALIRARLRSFNNGHSLCTVLITSACAGEGKTTIALHLAQAAASAGSRVLLIEADLRSPTLAAQLGIDQGPGLREAVAGTHTLEQSIQTTPLPVGTRTLDIVTAGAPTATPGNELLESHSLRELLDQAQAIYDLVLIDAPPLTTIADAFPLLHHTDGTIIVSRIGHTRRESAYLLHHTLQASRATQLGVIANEAHATMRHVRTAQATTADPSSPNGAAPTSSRPLETIDTSPR